MRHAILFSIALAFAGATGAGAGEHLQLRYGEPGYYAFPTNHASEMVAVLSHAMPTPTLAPRRSDSAPRHDRRHGAGYALALASVPLLVGNALVPTKWMVWSQLAVFFSH